MACGRTIKTIGLRLSRNFGRWACAVTGLMAGLALPLAFASTPNLPTSAIITPAIAAPIETTVSVAVNDGYARLVFAASEYIDATARMSGNVLIISFKQPINVTVDRVAVQASDYVGAARRDPDGKAVRMALAQKVTVNAMAAGEKFFVDLLPE